jgi:hypothetical protein
VSGLKKPVRNNMMLSSRSRGSSNSAITDKKQPKNRENRRTRQPALILDNSKTEISLYDSKEGQEGHYGQGGAFGANQTESDGDD